VFGKPVSSDQDGALPQTAQVVTTMSADTGGTPVI